MSWESDKQREFYSQVVSDGGPQVRYKQWRRALGLAITELKQVTEERDSLKAQLEEMRAKVGT